MRNSFRRAAMAVTALTSITCPSLLATRSAEAAPLVPAAYASGVRASGEAPSDYENPTPYYEVSPTGAVWPLGGATDYGSLASSHLNASVVGVTLTPDAGGYWLVGSDGGIFAFGDARFYGSTGSARLNQPIIGMTATPDGGGYWLYAADGGIFAFGDAHFYGSTGGMHLNQPIVGMTATPDGGGYWLYAGDGGIFAFGDAHFYGSTGSLHLNRPIVSLTATADRKGYWMIGSDGGVFSFGDAAFYGSLGGVPLGQSVARIVTAPGGGGYWELTHDGDLHPFGTAASATPPVIAVMHTVESPGDVAVEWAMSKLGVPYLWGGTGPGGYDCSGLVMKAWQAAGVTIPRVAADQYIAGTKVPMDQLVAGDLVYWASNTADPASVEHVAMYLGGGHMVNAPYTGQVVRTDWIGGGGFMTLGTHP